MTTMWTTTISSSIDIDAPAKAVWATLTDLESYPSWNPYFREASGEVAIGQTLILQAALTEDRVATSRARVLVAEPGVELRWASRLILPGIFDAQHRFTLVPRTPERIRFVQTEKLSGLLVPFARSLIANIQDRSAALDEALKHRVEVAPPTP